MSCRIKGVQHSDFCPSYFVPPQNETRAPLEILTRKLVQLSELTSHAKTRGIRALFLDSDGLDFYYHHPRKIKTNGNFDGKTKETKVVYSYFVIALLNERDY